MGNDLLRELRKPGETRCKGEHGFINASTEKNCYIYIQM